MNKKYFFFDYDGTLTDRRTMTLVPSSKQALDELQANGHFVALATGRAHYKARPLMEKLGLHNMVCNGGGAYVVNDQLIRNDPLDNQLIKQLLREAKANHFGYQILIDDSPALYSEDNLFNIQRNRVGKPSSCIPDPNFDFEKCDNIFKVYISITEADEYKLPTLKKLGHLRFVPDYIIIQHDKKNQGIIDLMNQIGAPLQDVVVFGDDTNDMIMFDPQWTSIAVGNACEELKRLANYVTDNSYDDGVYNACKKFKWI